MTAARIEAFHAIGVLAMIVARGAPMPATSLLVAVDEADLRR
jgi:hypothetical protein